MLAQNCGKLVATSLSTVYSTLVCFYPLLSFPLHEVYIQKGQAIAWLPLWTQFNKEEVFFLYLILALPLVPSSKRKGFWLWPREGGRGK